MLKIKYYGVDAVWKEDEEKWECPDEILRSLLQGHYDLEVKDTFPAQSVLRIGGIPGLVWKATSRKWGASVLLVKLKASPPPPCPVFGVQ